MRTQQIEEGILKIPQIETQLEHIVQDFKSSIPISVKTKLKAKQPITIVCYGDSMTYGTIQGGQAINNYPKVLQERLRYIYEYDTITVVNKGFPGQTSKYGFENFTLNVLNENPDMLIMSWGLNDNANVNPVSLIDFENYIRKMVTLAKENNIEVVISSPIPIISKTLGVMYELQNMNYKKLLESISFEQGVTFVDTYGEMLELFKKGLITYTNYETSGHLADYTIFSDILLSKCLSDIYTSFYNEGDYIPFCTNLVFNSVTSKGANATSKIPMFYNLYSNKMNEKIKILFFNNHSKNVNLDFTVWTHTSGSNIKLKNFGVDLTTFDTYSSSSNPNNIKSITLDKGGLYCLEIIPIETELSTKFASISGAIVSNINNIDLTLQNGWINSDLVGMSEPKAQKIGDRVYLSGIIHGGTKTQNTTLTTLPTTFRPNKSKIISVGSANVYVPVSGSIVIGSNGNVNIYTSSIGDYIFLDGVNYQI